MASLVGLLRDRMRMLREDAAAVSQVVEEAFQGRSELDDESLDKDLRQVFYDLQDGKVLDIRRVEVKDERGAQRRQYLWRIRDEDLAPAEARAERDPVERLYAKLPEGSWERKAPEPHAGPSSPLAGFH